MTQLTARDEVLAQKSAVFLALRKGDTTYEEVVRVQFQTLEKVANRLDAVQAMCGMLLGAIGISWLAIIVLAGIVMSRW